MLKISCSPYTRLVNRSPAPTLKANDFRGPFDKIWWVRAAISGRIGGSGVPGRNELLPRGSYELVGPGPPFLADLGGPGFRAGVNCFQGAASRLFPGSFSYAGCWPMLGSSASGSEIGLPGQISARF